MFDPGSFNGGAWLADDDYGRSLTYGGLGDAVARLGYDQLGGKRLVVIRGENSCAFLEHYIAAHLAGHAILLVSADASEDVVADYRIRFRPDRWVECSDGKADVTDSPQSGEDIHPKLSMMLSTSGSTGEPKFARFTADAMRANALSIIDYLDIDSAERALAHLPIQYSYGVSILNSHILAGAGLVLTNRSMMERSYWDRFERATSFSGVPFHYDMLERLRVFRRELPMMRTFTQAGGAMPAEQVRRFAEASQAAGKRLVVMYGQTEAAPRLAYLPPDDTIAHAGTIGVAIPGVELKLEADGGAVPDGEEGELVARSPSITWGYAASREDLGKGDEFGGVLRTGDLARREPSGYLRITGRMSRFIKLQGNRVNLAAVEQRLLTAGYPVVCAGNDNQLYIVTDDAEAVEAIEEFVLDGFEFAARAFTVVNLPTLPRNASQKPDYPAILAAVESAAGS